MAENESVAPQLRLLSYQILKGVSSARRKPRRRLNLILFFSSGSKIKLSKQAKWPNLRRRPANLGHHHSPGQAEANPSSSQKRSLALLSHLNRF